jgi:arabinose-5-phosphate isomerase
MDERIERARQIIDQEIHAMRAAASRLAGSFATVVDMILALPKNVVLTGMGKAGLIAQKASATLASTGTPSIFLHPAEAIHGDLGRVVRGDLLLALSKSGETAEVVRLIPQLKAIGVPIVAMTESQSSTVARHADVVLEMGRIEEAGSLALAPTASTAVMLALCDALALVVQEGRNFGPEEFARFHPGGALGRTLTKVEEVMRRGERSPVVRRGQSVLQALEVMGRTPGKPGSTNVVDSNGRLIGFFTDGDLRRLLVNGKAADLHALPIEDVMTRNPKTIGPERLMAEALKVLRDYDVDQLPVVDRDGNVLGLIDVQDILDVKVD